MKKLTLNMIITACVAIVFSFQAHASTCNLADEGLINLSITLDSSFNHNICDSVILTDGQRRYRSHWTHDLPHHSFHYTWEGLPAGHYVLKVQTLFQFSQTISFDLNKDTTFVLSNTMGMESVPIFLKSDLLYADTIEWVYTSSGCFGHYSERISLTTIDHLNYMLVKKFDSIALETIQGRKMFVTIPVEKSRVAARGIADSLFQLLDSSRCMKNRYLSSGILRLSTTHCELYVLIGKQLYAFDDRGIDEWDLYDRFRKQYLP